ncbi:MAG: hypothetical protein KBS59_05330 [Clostridiales bacterium]|nr:hypothetical protein [Clostridiales bacterium]
MKIFGKIIGFLRGYIGHMGAYFMICVLTLGLLGGENRTFAPEYFGVAVLFSALLALCDLVLALKCIKSVGAKSALHVGLSTVAFVLSFVLASGALDGSTGFVGAVFFAVFDAVCLCVRGIYISRVSRYEAEHAQKQSSDDARA